MLLIWRDLCAVHVVVCVPKISLERQERRDDVSLSLDAMLEGFGLDALGLCKWSTAIALHERDEDVDLLGDLSMKPLKEADRPQLLVSDRLQGCKEDLGKGAIGFVFADRRHALAVGALECNCLAFADRKEDRQSFAIVLTVAAPGLHDVIVLAVLLDG